MDGSASFVGKVLVGAEVSFKFTGSAPVRSDVCLWFNRKTARSKITKNAAPSFQKDRFKKHLYLISS
jgi:hypothetical protein